MKLKLLLVSDMRKIIIAIAAVIMFCLGNSCYAQTQPVISSYGRVGSWEIVSHRGDMGDEQCYLINRSSPENHKISFALMSSPLNKSLSIILKNKSWDIPDNKFVNVNFVFENNGKISLDGVVKYNMMIFQLPSYSQKLDFQMRLFGSKSFIIRFMNYGEPLWIIEGNRMEQVAKKFSSCLQSAVGKQ